MMPRVPAMAELRRFALTRLHRSVRETAHPAWGLSAPVVF
jgi:hypothetical protein